MVSKLQVFKVILIMGFFGFLSPFLTYAQQTHPSSACGEASTTFNYPEKILFNPENGHLYVFSETGLLTVLKESDLSVVKKFQAAEGFPKDFAFNIKTGLLYILDNRPGKIRVYDTETLVSKGVIDIPKTDPTELFQINVDEDTNKLYVLDRLGTRFLVIDAEKKSVDKEYKIVYASAFWVNYKTKKVYFRSQGVGGIQELDLASGKITDIKTGPQPNDLAVDTVNNRILVVDPQARNLVAIDAVTRKVFKIVDLSLIGAPRFITVSEKLNMAVATCFTNNAAFYNLKTLDLVKHVVLPENSQPERTFFDEDRKLAYIPNYFANAISVIDLNTFQIIRNVHSGFLRDAAFYRHNFLIKSGLITPSGNFYLTYPNSQNISRLTPDGDITFVGGYSKNEPIINYCPADNPIFAYPDFMAFNGDNSKVYVANAARFITVLDAKADKPLKKISLERGALNITYQPKLDKIFVDRIDSVVSVIDVKSDQVVANIKVGIRPRQIIPNTLSGDTYILTVLSNAITVIHPDLSTSEIKLDSEPIDGKYDAVTDRLFVSTFNSAFVIDTKDHRVLKTLPELHSSNVFNAAGKIIFADAFNNYFTVVDPANLEAKKVNFANPFSVAYYELAKKTYIIDLFDTKIGVFDANFNNLTTIKGTNVARNFGTTFLTASDHYVYRLDDPNSTVQVIDPNTDITVTSILLTGPKTSSGENFTSTITAFAVDNKNEKIYISNAPFPQVTVLYLADISKFATKIISGRFGITLAELLKQYWWTGFIVLVAIIFAIYYFLRKQREVVAPPIPPVASIPKV